VKPESVFPASGCCVRNKTEKHAEEIMDEKICSICHFGVDIAYLLLQGKYYHLDCWVNKIRTEGEPADPLMATLYEILIIHGF
jgi:hypothetical protein